MAHVLSHEQLDMEVLIPSMRGAQKDSVGRSWLTLLSVIDLAQCSIWDFGQGSVRDLGDKLCASLATKNCNKGQTFVTHSQELACTLLSLVT